MSINPLDNTRSHFTLIDEIYTEKLDQGLKVGLAINSSSMLPTIRPGSFITFKKMSSYNIGDIIVISDDSKYIVHRIVAFNGDLVLTRGDNNTKNDGYTENRFIKGKVISVKGESQNIYDLYGLTYIRVRQFFLRILIKTKNFVFQNSNNFFLKIILYFLYKLQIWISSLYFTIFENSNLYVRGSYVTKSLKPGLSDIDFVVLLDPNIKIHLLVKTLRRLSFISPMITFNSLLPIEVYEKLYNYGELEDYNSDQLKRLSGKLNVNTVNLPSRNKESIELDDLIKRVRLIDELMFKLSQIGIYHSSYLFHNIQKILKKLFVIIENNEEKKELQSFIEKEASAKTIRADLPKYARILELILNDIKVPECEDINLDTENSFKIEIFDTKYILFQGIRRIDTYILNSDFKSSNILEILLYTIESRIYPTSISIMTKEIASYLQRYNYHFINEKEFEHRDIFAMKYLNDSILLMNHFQILKEKDRLDLERSTIEIINLSLFFILKTNSDFQLDRILQEVLDSYKYNENLNSEQFYYKHISKLNELYLLV
jgi:signal peptidase I